MVGRGREGGREGAAEEERNVWTFYTVWRLFGGFFPHLGQNVDSLYRLQLFKAQNENQNLKPGAKYQLGSEELHKRRRAKPITQNLLVACCRSGWEILAPRSSSSLLYSSRKKAFYP